MLNAVTAKTPRTLRTGSQAGFSLPELLISITIFLIISGVVTQALLQMTNSQRTIWNRTQMHSGVRSATELLQQEVGQAGRISLPYTTTLAAAVPSGTQTVGVKQQVAALPAAAVASVKGIFVGEQLTIDAGEDALGNELQETVTVTALDTAGNTITAVFALNHPTAPIPVMVLGGFANGIVPLAPAFPNGSTATLLKLFGDINGNGNMVYVEYKCDTAGGNLYRNVMPYDQTTAKTAPTSSQILLNNIQANPDGTGCFTFEPNPLPGPYTINGVAYNFVLDVAITLTVKTQNRDPVTNLFQLETKALLNVSPRNVFNVWQLAQAGISNRVQPNPPTVTNLLIG
jgi:prepilin-type N-terminal cleavage/methylation domain-containing protein